MSSISRAFSQKNTNITQIIPELVFVTPSGEDLSGVSIYSINLQNVVNSGGVFFVDLSGNDASGNPIDGSGYIKVNSTTMNTVWFIVNSPSAPGYNPGFEYTVFFRNQPANIDDNGFTIGLVSENAQIPFPIPYILSPPAPIALEGQKASNSVTFKSDGEYYNVISSGPSGWLGLVAFISLLGGGFFIPGFAAPAARAAAAAAAAAAAPATGTAPGRGRGRAPAAAPATAPATAP